MPNLLQKTAVSLCVGLFAVALGGFCAAGQPETPGSKQHVKTLIEELNSSRRAVRAEAQQQLLKLGPDVLPLLPPPELLPNTSVRETVRRVRIALERRQAHRSVEPSRVTLQGTFSLEEALSAVASQTGNPLDLSGLSEERRGISLKLDFKNRTFWRVMDDLLRRAELQYARKAGSDALVLESSQQPNGAAVQHAGAFRIAVESVQFRPLFGDKKHRLLRVGFSVAAEPRLRPLFLEYTGRSITARTASGNRLPAFTPEAHRERPLGRGGKWVRLHSNFLVPTDGAFSRIKLAGHLSLTVAAGEHRIAFGELLNAQGVARRRGGVTVTLKQADFKQAEEDRREAKLAVSVGYDTGGPAFESHRTWIFHNDVYLESDDGSRIPPEGGFETSLQRDGGVAVAYRFKNLLHPPQTYRFVYVAPTLIIEVPIEFAFEEIPVGEASNPS